MNVFVGTTANNLHTQQIGLALHEAGRLHTFGAPVLDLATRPWHHALHRLRRRLFPAFDARLRRRRPPGIPATLTAERSWDALLWQATGRLPIPLPWTDLLWERQEHAFARWCGRRLALAPRPDTYLGTEHGALEALHAARALGLCSGVIFASAHHTFQSRWLDPIYQRYPGMLDAASRCIRDREPLRNHRRDLEMAAADFIHANSEFTASTLRAAGVPAEKLITVPLGAPPALPPEALRPGPPAQPVVIFAGNVSVHKGAHLLLEAWRQLPPGAARLDFYGHSLLPADCLTEVPPSVRFHGPVPYAELQNRLRQASLLVLPSLCEGFGMVVTEAMAQGIPVLCSAHVGAAQLIEPGINGLVVPAGDATALATALRWALDHPVELNGMGHAAAATARAWSWAHFRQTFVQKLDAFLTSNHPTRPGL